MSLSNRLGDGSRIFDNLTHNLMGYLTSEVNYESYSDCDHAVVCIPCIL